MKKLLQLLLVTAMLVPAFTFSQDQCAPVGWATLNGGTTGGGNATPVTVTTLSALQTQASSSGAKVIYVSGTMGTGVGTRVNVAANKTIIGLPGAKLIGGFDVKASNVIIRNMIVQGPGAVDVNGVDCITIDGSSTSNVWIDHCDIYDGQDGNLDITNGANYIAITWCKFYYTSASTNHQFCNLIGNSDTKTSDRGRLKVTMMYNWWGAGCKERMPRVRYGQVHVVNNYFSNTSNSHCVRAGREADIRVESNYFDGVKIPIDLYQNDFTAVTAVNNTFVSTSGNTSGSGTAFTPPYTLSITPSANVKAAVMAGAGATLSSPTSCGGAPPTTYILSTTASPTAGGTVSGAGTYNSGTNVTVTATAAAGYTFTGWSGDASGTATTITVNMNSNKNVVANFQATAPTTYTLTTTANPSAGGTVSGAGTYNSGTSVTVTATPAAGYTFAGWSGDASGTNTTVSITMNSNKAVTANFQANGGGGTTTIRIEDDAITATGLCLYEGAISNNSGADNGKVINLTNAAAKAVEWRVGAAATGTYTLNWRYVNSSTSNTYSMQLVVNGVTINAALPFPKTSGSTVFANTTTAVSLNAGNNTIRLESITSNATADIDWIEISGNAPTAANCSGEAPVNYTLSTTSAPAAGGTVTGAGSYTSGTNVTVTATPAAGYTFTGWSGDASGTNTSVSISMNSNKSVTANFAPITYTLTTTANPAAGGSVSGAGTYNSGTNVTVTATPAAGYTFTGWSGDASGTNTSVSISMNSNKSITANFAPITYTLTTTANPAAGGSVSGAGTYNSGTNVTVTATPAAGYTFTGWSGDASGTNTSVSISMNSNKAVTANFAPITYTLTTTANPAAGGSVSGAGTYNSGTNVTVTATPAAGYTFTGWSGDASGTNTSVSISMNSNKAVTANFQLSTVPTTIRIEDDATSATGLCLYEGTISNNSGANNGKVINLTNSTAKGVNWRVGVPATGSYTLNWRYVNSSTSNTFSMKLIVNGVTIDAALPFPKTSGSTVFANTTATVTLNAGNNLIRLESTTNSATADIDWIEITGNNPTAANCAAARPLPFATTTQNMDVEAGSQKAGVYPNPANGIAYAVFHLPISDKITVRIVASDGRVVSSTGSRTMQAGNQKVELNLAGFRSGLYSVQITGSHTGKRSYKLIIQ
jgi:uncharacterized repeat protein (TIGR02543 family)